MLTDPRTLLPVPGFHDHFISPTGQVYKKRSSGELRPLKARLNERGFAFTEIRGTKLAIRTLLADLFNIDFNEAMKMALYEANQLLLDANRLTASQVREIRRLRQCGMTQAALGQRFGVSREHIRDIINGKAWTSETQDPVGNGS